jgi:thiamine biosynthesis lipoprotein
MAKGYAVGEAVNALKDNGVKNALVDAGGDVYVLGNKNGVPWRIGIKDPFGSGIIGVLEGSNMAVFTSGNYERFFMKDGVRYHHILDPQTGYPARGLASVTVISSDPVLADAWATAIFVMGEKKGIKAAEKISGKIILVNEKGRIYSSPELAGIFKIVKH